MNVSVSTLTDTEISWNNEKKWIISEKWIHVWQSSGIQWRIEKYSFEMTSTVLLSCKSQHVSLYLLIYKMPK